MKLPLLSVVIPVYNSEKSLPILYKRLTKTLKKNSISYECIFVDDASKDASWKILNEIFIKDNKIRLFQLARNFGQHNALMCGFSKSKGKYIVTLDDDLQTPPEEIVKLFQKIGDGYDVVYGQYLKKNHSIFRNIGSNLVQFIYKSVFGVPGKLTSFRMIQQETVKEILHYQRNYTFVDGLLAWQTRNIGYVQVSHEKRLYGKSNYTIFKLVSLSINMLTNFSIFPLQLASLTGFTLSFLGLIFSIFYFFKKIFFGIPVTGYTSIMISILIFSGVQLVTIGIIGEYIGRIHLNINQKPQYTIRKIKERI